MAHLQLAWTVDRYNGDEGAAEETLHQSNVLAGAAVDLVQDVVRGGQREETVTILVAHKQGAGRTKE